MSSELEVQVIDEVVQEPAAKPVPKDKKPLTHRLGDGLSAAQLRDVERCVIRPAEVTKAQFPARTGDKNNEGKARRRPHNTRSTVMHEQTQLPEVPKSNNTPEESPPSAIKAAIGRAANVPYGKAAAKGAVFGAAAVTSGAALWFGGKWVVGKIKGSPGDSGV